MPPTEVPVTRSLDALAPAVKLAAVRVLQGMKDRGFNAMPYDTFRTPDRQAYLFGKGRVPEQCIEAGLSAYWAWPTCADGKVTNAALSADSWHGYGLAWDCVENDATPWTAAQAFWHAVADLGVTFGFVSGASWKRFPDLPHLQWNKCPVSPTEDDKLLLKTRGVEAVWAKYHATA